ncbi:acetyl-coenzyme-A carboxylase [Coelomomyces lativittatus]|nr:acetyl-coenzyme-A carboxylase [Coelomomyces lativittatus]
MRLAESARHLEVQILADEYGNVISLFGRDCSVQRRHQKIIEEAPVTIASETVFEQMEMSAIRLAKLVGYINAGTVEFLYDTKTDRYYFLELNPRLQVEHPTTEMVSGVNIPAAQLQVAMGISLHRIPHLRLLYGLQPNAASEIDFHFQLPQSHSSQRKPAPRGHVIACRITAENPDAGFKPSGGQLVELNFRSSTDVWGYFSVTANGGLHEFADSQFGHVFAYGHDRYQATQSMIIALKELCIRGDFRTTIDYLITLLESTAFQKNEITTSWLDVLIEQKIKTERPDRWVCVICGAAMKAFMASMQQRLLFLKKLEKGQVPALATLNLVFPIVFILDDVKYQIQVTLAAPDVFILRMNGSSVSVQARSLSDGGVLLTFSDATHTVYLKEEPQGDWLQVHGRTVVLEKETDPTLLLSPSSGKLLRWVIEDGSHVHRGDTYAEIEVMKMVMPLVANHSGKIKSIKQCGAPIFSGEILGTLDLDDPSCIQSALPCTEGFPCTSKSPSLTPMKTHQQYLDLKATLEHAIDGFEQNESFESLLNQFFDIQSLPELPFLHVHQVFSSFLGRLPPHIITKVLDLLAYASPNHTNGPEIPEFPHVALLECLSPFAVSHDITLLLQTIQSYQYGLISHLLDSLVALLRRYLSTESIFSLDAVSRHKEKAVLEQRHEYDKDVLYWMCYSHAMSSVKTPRLVALLDKIQAHRSFAKQKNSNELFSVLSALADLLGPEYSPVKIRARSLLLSLQQPDFEERFGPMSHLLSHITETVYLNCPSSKVPCNSLAVALRPLVDCSFTIFDVLPEFFYSERYSASLKLVALEAYIRRAYNTYNVYGVRHHPEFSVPLVEWHFQFPVHDFGDTIFRTASVSDLTLMLKKGETGPVRVGFMAALTQLNELETSLEPLLALFPNCSTRSSADVSPLTYSTPLQDEPWHVLNVCFLINKNDSTTDVQHSAFFSHLFSKFPHLLRQKRVRRITIILFKSGGHYPRFFTFREHLNYEEDLEIRHIEPSHAYQLELHRLTHFAITPISTTNKNIHMYYAVAKQNTIDTRFFVRAIVRPGELTSPSVSLLEYLTAEADTIVNDILDSLELASALHPNTDCNHLFINFIPQCKVQPEDVMDSFSGFIQRHGKRLWRLRVSQAEVRFIIHSSHNDTDRVSTIKSVLKPNGQVASSASPPVPYRFIISNISGVLKAEVYREVKDHKGQVVLHSLLEKEKGSFHLTRADMPYPTKEKVQPKRYRAHIIGTTYVYDYLDLFKEAVHRQWNKVPHLTQPDVLMKYQEYVLENKKFVKVHRAPGHNTCGMVTWLVTLYTPEAPQGRSIVLIANDITFAIGSFGPEEDALFYAASQFARELKCPRIYLSANSGARIGLAEEIMDVFQVAWVDPLDVLKGFKYLYVTPQEAMRLKDSIQVEEIQDDGEVRMKLTAIIGAKDGLGVENLKGSGLIAGETSLAYDEIVTFSLVTCRSVGIGAYLVRLGQRTIQVEGQPIILTGAAALNKVLGREVYTSNLQLGGTHVMYRNGITHVTCMDSLQGVQALVHWLSYVPCQKDHPLPIFFLPSHDPVDRQIEFLPTSFGYDPRHLLAGHLDPTTQQFVTGFFDRGSFMELMAGWAPGIVVGRARLGGIPFGTIAVETRLTESVVPADPSDPESFEKTLMEAPGVWTPCSAFKTAQAIRDLHREQLPLLIFANFRGFSGGQRDMYEGILKFGSYIVDALREFTSMPVFVYIVPQGELRGGAWVVLDPSIQPWSMELYADSQSKGGVIESAGIVEIKYRKPQLLATLERLDPEYQVLKQQLHECVTSSSSSQSSSSSPEEEEETTKNIAVGHQKLKDRQTHVLPMIQQIALTFAELHDTPQRMLAKQTIRRILHWPHSRAFFYWRTQRRLKELPYLQQLKSLQLPSDLLSKWYRMDGGVGSYDEEDAHVYHWLMNPETQTVLNQRLDQLRSEAMTQQVLEWMQTKPEMMAEAFLRVLKLNDSEKKTKS